MLKVIPYLYNRKKWTGRDDLNPRAQSASQLFGPVPQQQLNEKRFSNPTRSIFLSCSVGTSNIYGYFLSIGGIQIIAK
jgi:hypothetical protein